MASPPLPPDRALPIMTLYKANYPSRTQLGHVHGSGFWIVWSLDGFLYQSIYVLKVSKDKSKSRVVQCVSKWRFFITQLAHLACFFSFTYVYCTKSSALCSMFLFFTILIHWFSHNEMLQYCFTVFFRDVICPNATTWSRSWLRCSTWNYLYISRPIQIETVIALKFHANIRVGTKVIGVTKGPFRRHETFYTSTTQSG